MDEQVKGAFHLASKPELYDPARSNTFELIVHDVENLNLEDSQETLRISVKKVNIPDFEQGVVSLQRTNNKVKFAGVVTFSEGSIDLYDFIDTHGRSAIKAWQKLSYDIDTETVGRAKNYKKSCTLIEYTPDFEAIRAWDVVGAWISKVSNDEYDHENDGSPRGITATLVFDYIKYNDNYEG